MIVTRIQIDRCVAPKYSDETCGNPAEFVVALAQNGHSVNVCGFHIVAGVKMLEKDKE